MREKYSTKVTLLVQEKQNLIQRSKEMEEEEGEEERRRRGQPKRQMQRVVALSETLKQRQLTPGTFHT